MSNTGIHLSRQDKIDIAGKLNCQTDEIARAIKISLIGEETSHRLYTDFFGIKQKKEECDHEDFILSTLPSMFMTMRSDLLSRSKFTSDNGDKFTIVKPPINN